MPGPPRWPSTAASGPRPPSRCASSSRPTACWSTGSSVPTPGMRSPPCPRPLPPSAETSPRSPRPNGTSSVTPSWSWTEGPTPTACRSGTSRTRFTRPPTCTADRHSSPGTVSWSTVMRPCSSRSTPRSPYTTGTGRPIPARAPTVPGGRSTCSAPAPTGSWAAPAAEPDHRSTGSTTGAASPAAGPTPETRPTRRERSAATWTKARHSWTLMPPSWRLTTASPRPSSGRRSGRRSRTPITPRTATSVAPSETPIHPSRTRLCSSCTPTWIGCGPSGNGSQVSNGGWTRPASTAMRGPTQGSSRTCSRGPEGQGLGRGRRRKTNSRIRTASTRPSWSRPGTRTDGDRALGGDAQDPQAGVHVAGQHQVPLGVVVHPPHLGRLGQHPPLGWLDRVVAGRRHEVGDLGRAGRVAHIQHPDPVRIPGGVHGGADDQRVVDRVVTGSRGAGAQGVRGPVLADLHRVGRIREVIDPQVAQAPLDVGAGVLAEVLVGGEQQLAGVVVAGGVGVAVLIGGVVGVAQQDRGGGVGDVQGDKAAVPVGQKYRLAVGRGLGAVAVHWVGVTALAGAEGAAGVVEHAPVRHLNRGGRVGDVDEAEVAPALLIPIARGRALLGVLAGRHARVDEGAAKIGSVLDLELMDPAGAAAGVEQPQLDGGGRVGHVPQHQPPGKALIQPGAAADLQAGGGDVPASQGAEAGGEHHHVLGRGAGRIDQPRDHAGVGRVAVVDHRNPVVGRGGAEAGLAALGPVGEPPVPDICEALMGPDIGVEPAAAQVVLADDLHVERLGGLLAALIQGLGLLQAMLFVLEQLVLVGRGGQRGRGRQQQEHGGEGGGKPEAAHGDPLWSEGGAEEFFAF